MLRRPGANRRGLRGFGARAGAVVPAWEPSQLASGLHYWDMALGVTTGAGPTVSSVANQVGAPAMANVSAAPAYEASQAIFGGAPAAAMTAASSQFLRATITEVAQAYTTWIVGSWSTVAVTNVLQGSSLANRTFAPRFVTTGGGRSELYAGTTVCSDAVAPSAATAYLYVCVISNNAAAMYVNGTARALSSQACGTLLPSRWEWGHDGSTFGSVRVAAGGIVSGVMSADDRASLLAWAQANKGVA